MQYLFISAVIFSSFSFLAYSVSYFVLPNMKAEFKRFKVENLGLLTIILEIFGAIGLLVGLYFKPLLLLSSGGLSLLMFFGLLFRIKSKDSLRISLPALIYMFLNAWIFYYGMN